MFPYLNLEIALGTMKKDSTGKLHCCSIVHGGKGSYCTEGTHLRPDTHAGPDGKEQNLVTASFWPLKVETQHEEAYATV